MKRTFVKLLTIALMVLIGGLSSLASARKWKYVGLKGVVLRSPIAGETVNPYKPVNDRGIVCASYPPGPHVDNELYVIRNIWGGKELGVLEEGSHFCFYAEIGKLELEVVTVFEEREGFTMYYPFFINPGEVTHLSLVQVQGKYGDSLYVVCVPLAVGESHMEKTVYKVPMPKRPHWSIGDFLQPGSITQLSPSNQGLRGDTCRTYEDHIEGIKVFR